MSRTFTDVDVAALLRIAGEANELGDDLQTRRRHILQRLLKLVGGCWAVCSEMDPRHTFDTGWAVPNSITQAGDLSSGQQIMIDRYVTGRLAALDPCIPHLLHAEKPVVTIRRTDTDVVDHSWYRSEHFNTIRRPLGFGESLYAKWSTPDGRNLKLSMHRELTDAPFSDRDVQLVQVFHENLPAVYSPRRGTGAAPQDSRVAQLPARLQPVLERLLKGDSEKQAALALGLSQHTIHAYVKAIYRAFGAASRAELLAKFIPD